MKYFYDTTWIKVEDSEYVATIKKLRGTNRL